MIKIFPVSVSYVLLFVSVLSNQIVTLERLSFAGDKQTIKINIQSCHRLLDSAPSKINVSWSYRDWALDALFNSWGKMHAYKPSPFSALNQQGIQLIVLFYGLLTQIKKTH